MSFVWRNARNTEGGSRRYYERSGALRQTGGSCNSSAKRVNRNDVRDSAQNAGEPALHCAVNQNPLENYSKRRYVLFLVIDAALWYLSVKMELTQENIVELITVQCSAGWKLEVFMDHIIVSLPDSTVDCRAVYRRVKKEISNVSGGIYPKGMPNFCLRLGAVPGTLVLNCQKLKNHYFHRPKQGSRLKYSL